MSKPLSIEHRKNLKELALFLLSTDCKIQLDMSLFFDSDVSIKESNNCETVCCVVGVMGILKPELQEPNEEDTIDWRRLCKKFCGLENDNPDWIWLFGSKWRSRDNSRLGVAKRILNYLRVGRPLNWYVQLDNANIPLSYRGEI